MNMGIVKASDASTSCTRLIPGLNIALKTQVLTTTWVLICIFGVVMVLFCKMGYIFCATIRLNLT